MGALERLDALLFAAEKTIVWVLLCLMGLVMFLSVAHRAGSAIVNPVSAPAWFVQALGPEAWLWLAPVAMAGVLAGVCVLAFRTRGHPQALGLGVGLGLGLTVLVWGFVTLLPSGLVMAQPMALSLLLWLSMMGASLAAHDHRHLAIDMGAKIWPEALRPKVAAVGHGVSAVFCLGMSYLAFRSVGQHFSLWTESDGAAGVLSGTAIPKWFAAAAIPYGGLVLAFRFSLEAVRAWQGALEEVDELAQLGIQTEKQGETA